MSATLVAGRSMASHYGSLKQVSKFEYLFNRKFKNGFTVKFFSCIQDGGGKMWLVRRIREMLCLQAKASTLVINNSIFTPYVLQKISTIKMNGRLSCVHIHSSS